MLGVFVLLQDNYVSQVGFDAQCCEDSRLNCGFKADGNHKSNHSLHI